MEIAAWKKMSHESDVNSGPRAKATDQIARFNVPEFRTEKKLFRGIALI